MYNINCQNCRNSFTLTEEDQAFFEKMKVPLPTWCADCRAQRRMSFCNERNLYRANCGLCGKSSISMYHPSAVFPIYCRECFWSDKWDGLSYGQDYDFSRPFFQQFHELKKKVPRVALLQQGNMEGSDYTNRSSNAKNCYLSFRTNFSEDCYYTHPANDSKSVVDCLNVQKSELTYASVDCIQCYNVAFCQETQNCNDSRFLYDCRGCTDCFGCANLRNKQYHIFNQAYSRDEYFAKIKQINLGDYSQFKDFQAQFSQFILKYIRPYMVSLRSDHVTGNWIYDSNNVLNSFGVRNVENGKNIYGIINAKDCMDYYFWGRECELIYEVASCGYSCTRIAFSNEIMTSCAELQYCDNSSSISNCFGCVGIKNKKFCILNKQYTEAEYKELLPRVIEQMNAMPYADKKGRVYKYGEFFPSELSPFAYNETAAVEFFPLTSEEALEAGFVWRHAEVKDFGVTVKAADLP
ncbi:zinc-ribbon domain containing protein, partial [Candidatus Uhrbacteria bacterium]|nr:zinc-ribbon domain containing protein [Candidatus Uhrbacteria bacterium]